MKAKVYLTINIIYLLIAFTLSVFAGFNIFIHYSEKLENDPEPDLSLSFEDKFAPEVKLQLIDSDFYLNHAVATLRSREKLTIDGAQKTIEFQFQNPRENYYELVLKLNNEGENKLTLNVTDINKNKYSKEINPKRVLLYDQTITLDYIEPYSHSIILDTKENNTTYVSPDFRLPADYRPQELVSISELKINNFNGGFLKKEAGESLYKMQEDMKKAGVNMYVTSAFRPFQQQAYTYNSISTNEGAQVAASKAARPGYSEHQLGLAVDIVNDETNFRLPSPFEKTNLYTWLENNAYKYGFVKSYDGSDTRINTELWHWRYVGVEHATKIKEQNIAPLEYLKTLNNNI